MSDTLFLETVHASGVAHVSYVIGHDGQAAVVDPRRDTDVYVEIARKHQSRITHIFETHKNEDYVTGSLDLQRRSGADIYHGKGLEWEFGKIVADGDTFQLGDIRLRVLQTPGHTDESISLALSDVAFSDDPVAVFTGDALFLGDVGRTDFYPDRAEEVAGLLYDSIFEKILPLGDHVLLYPAHGAGSVCGSGMAAREFSTLGYERKFNPALQAADRDEFIRNKTGEHHYKPPYFKKMEEYNKNGSAPPMKEAPNPQTMTPEAFEQAMDDGAQVIDLREPEAFAGAFVPGSLNIPLDMLSAYGGYLLSYERPILLVADDPRDVSKAVVHFLRIGYDRVEGYLHDGLHGWETSGRELDGLSIITAGQLKKKLGTNDAPMILDVRKIDEYRDGRLEDAVHMFLGELQDRIGELPQGRPVVTFCGSGRRASIAASILRRHGVQTVSNNLGSMAACKAVGCEIIK